VKILQVHNYYQYAGGEDRVIDDERDLLSQNGHDVFRFTKTYDDMQGRSNFQLARNAIWCSDVALEFEQCLKEHEPDVVHFHNTQPLISHRAYYIAREAGAAVVQTLHNYRMICPQGTFMRDGKLCEDCLGKTVPWPAIQHGCYRDSRAASCVTVSNLVVHRLMGTYRKAVDAYIACSEFTRNKHIKAGFSAENLHVKPNFVSEEPDCGPGDGDFAFYLGRLSPEKGVKTLLEAWQQMPHPVPLKIVGTGPLYDWVKDQALRTPGVECLGWQNDEQVAQLMDAARFMILPSINFEGFPKTIVEAYAKCMPIVASNMGAMSDLIIHGQTGLHFEPGNAADLSQKVTELNADESRLREMRRAARNEFETKYTKKRNLEILTEIYKQALQKARKPIAADNPDVSEKPANKGEVVTALGVETASP